MMFIDVAGEHGQLDIRHIDFEVKIVIHDHRSAMEIELLNHCEHK